MTELKVVRFNGLEQDDEGVYVMHSDYARLAARVQELEGRLKGEVHWLEAENVEQHIRSLEAEITRLRRLHLHDTAQTR